MKKILTKRPKDYILLTKEAVKFETAEGLNGINVLKQHGFVEVDRENPFEFDESYKGNMSLCGRIGIHDGDSYVNIDTINDEPLDLDCVCKNCLKIYNKLVSINKT